MILVYNSLHNERMVEKYMRNGMTYIQPHNCVIEESHNNFVILSFYKLLG